MAGAAVIGALRVNLGLDSAKFTKGLKGAKGSMGRFKQAAITGFKALAVAAAAAFAAMAAGVGAFLKQADEMTKLAQAIGVPVEELTALRHAADLSGVSIDQLSTGMRKLSQNMVTVAQGSVSDVMRAFQALGIEVEKSDGTLKSSGEVLLEVSERFARMEDGATKTGLAMAIFGRAGAGMIPLLNAGSAGIAEMTAEAKRLGLTFTEQTGKAAEHFNDQMLRVNSVFRAFTNQLTQAMLPTLTVLANAMVDTATDGQTLANGAQAIGRWFENLIVLTADLSSRISIVGRNFKALGQAFMAAATGNFSRAFDIIMARQDGAKIDVLLHKKMLAELRAELDKFDFVVPDRVVRDFKVIFGDLADSAAKASKKAAKDAAKAAKDAAREATAAIDAMNRNFERVGDTIAGLISGTLDWRQALGEVVKLISQAVISQANIGASGGAGNLLSGLLGGLFGFAHGGSFKVGGAGGQDSQIAAFKVSPGETVSIRTPSQDRMMAAGARVAIEISPAKFFDARVREVSGNVAVKVSGAMIGQTETARRRAALTGADSG